MRCVVHNIEPVHLGFWLRMFGCSRCSFRLEFHRDPFDMTWYRSGVNPSPDQLAASEVKDWRREPGELTKELQELC